MTNGAARVTYCTPMAAEYVATPAAVHPMTAIAHGRRAFAMMRGIRGLSTYPAKK